VPLIEVNVFEDELSPDQTKDLIRKLTEAVTTVVDPRIRDVVWVVVHDIKSGNWGAGSKRHVKLMSRFDVERIAAER
jgi:phenylpyruvate tautomerase PptA (4-oxalocrotonate tautomerase family)